MAGLSRDEIEAYRMPRESAKIAGCRVFRHDARQHFEIATGNFGDHQNKGDVIGTFGVIVAALLTAGD